MLEVTPTLLEETDETTVGFVRIYFEFPAVQSEKYVRRKEGHPLFPVNEGMIH